MHNQEKHASPSNQTAVYFQWDVVLSEMRFSVNIDDVINGCENVSLGKTWPLSTSHCPLSSHRMPYLLTGDVDIWFIRNLFSGTLLEH